ncbi:MAG TPA: replicative DNA helicase [Nevskiaceae bacterium]|nr:replicative DNA helicase [Nevskiaceae bacterium]
MQNPPKHPPHSLEAEMSVLGGMMLDNRAGQDVLDRLSEADFYIASHQVIFRGIVQLLSSHAPCDFITLTEHLRHASLLEQAGGIAYLGSLVNDTPSAANVRSYAEIVRERSILRKLIEVGQDTAEMGFRPEGRPPAELLDQAEQKIFALREGDKKSKAQYFEMPPLMDQLEKQLEVLSNSTGGLGGLETGFVDFDKKTGGLRAGDLIIIAGRPGMGKTSLAMNIAENVAIDKKLPAAVFSMEMSAEQLAMRVISSFGRVDQQNLRTGQLTDMDWSRLSSAIGLVREAPLYIDETGALSPLELRARARRIAARHGLSLIVIDYIQLMQVPGSENRTNEISEISRNLKALAKELSCPIIALSQLNRGVESRDNKRPRMSDLRESGGIEQDADLVVFVYRDEYYNENSTERGVAEIIIGKQRNGPTGTVKTAFHGQYTRFDNLAQGDGYGGGGYE